MIKALCCLSNQLIQNNFYSNPVSMSFVCLYSLGGISVLRSYVRDGGDENSTLTDLQNAIDEGMPREIINAYGTSMAISSRWSQYVAYVLSNILTFITGCAVAQHCYNGDVSFLWGKNGNFDPL